MKRRALRAATAALAAVVASAVIFVGVPSAPAATGTIPYLWKNCTHVHTKYPHGVGRVGARDRTSGVPVTTWRSTRLYNIAMHYNKGLDGDKDGIACEKR
jgi:hypothetical protein